MLIFGIWSNMLEHLEPPTLSRNQREKQRSGGAQRSFLSILSNRFEHFEQPTLSESTRGAEVGTRAKLDFGHCLCDFETRVCPLSPMKTYKQRAASEQRAKFIVQPREERDISDCKVCQLCAQFGETKCSGTSAKSRRREFFWGGGMQTV